MCSKRPGFTIDSEILGKNVMQHVKWIDNTKYRTLRILGIGSEGIVFLAEKKFDKKLVAIKITFDEEQTTSIYNSGEYNHWSNIKHQNCLQLYEKILHDDAVYYVMEYAENLTLLDWIQETWHCCLKLGQKLPNEQLLRLWTCQMIDAIKYLHNLKLYHLDIKPDNVFLDRNWNVKIGDFGFLFCGEETSRPFDLGCTLYRPPEGLVDILPPMLDLEKADVWSLGATVLEMLTGKIIAAKSFSLIDLSTDVCKRNLLKNIPILHTLTEPFEEGLDLVKLLLCWEPRKRPSFSTVVAHPWLRIDWSQLERNSLRENPGTWYDPIVNTQTFAMLQEFGYMIIGKFQEYINNPENRQTETPVKPKKKQLNKNRKVVGNQGKRNVKKVQ